jgi:hypothetical protein
MILYDNDFLNENEINYILDFSKIQKFEPFRKEIIYFNNIELTPHKFDLSSIKNNVFKKSLFSTIRLQKYDESINQITSFHSHNDIHNYLIFLNDNFEGGELEFECGILIKPKKGSIVYFNNNERHRVKNCLGERYTLVLSGNKQIDISNFSIRKRNGLL